jgi:hypothetical protein
MFMGTRCGMIVLSYIVAVRGKKSLQHEYAEETTKQPEHHVMCFAYFKGFGQEIKYGNTGHHSSNAAHRQLHAAMRWTKQHWHGSTEQRRNNDSSTEK